MSKKRIGILVSGRGSNMESIVRASLDNSVSYDVAVCVSDKARAKAVEKAGAMGIPAVVVRKKDYADRDAFEDAMADVLDGYSVDLVVLAGFMRLLSPHFIRRFPNRIVNIHPSLLPSFPGLDAQAQAVAHGARVSGLTIHFVNEGLDSGPIIFQYPVPVLPGDSASDLADRILQFEHEFYARAIDLVVSGDFHLDGRRVFLEREIKGTFKSA